MIKAYFPIVLLFIGHFKKKYQKKVEKQSCHDYNHVQVLDCDSTACCQKTKSYEHIVKRTQKFAFNSF